MKVIINLLSADGSPVYASAQIEQDSLDIHPPVTWKGKVFIYHPDNFQTGWNYREHSPIREKTDYIVIPDDATFPYGTRPFEPGV